MGAARGTALGLAGTVALADHSPIASPHRNAHLGDINGMETAVVLPIQYALALDRLTIPAIEAKDTIGFGNGVPALDVGQRPALKLPGVDIGAIQLALERSHLFFGKAHHLVLTLSTGTGLESSAPATAAPSLSSANK